jgi:hypothetical protein
MHPPPRVFSISTTPRSQTSSYPSDLILPPRPRPFLTHHVPQRSCRPRPCPGNCTQQARPRRSLRPSEATRLLGKDLWKTDVGLWQREEDVQRGDEPIEDTRILPDVLPSKHLVMTPPDALPDVWDLHSQRIFVRSEYRETEKAALLANEDDIDVFVITGQPGIGTPPFLSVPCRI